MRARCEMISIGKQQPGNPPDGPGKVLQIADSPLLFDAVEVVVEKRETAMPSGTTGCAGRRHDAGNQAQQGCR